MSIIRMFNEDCLPAMRRMKDKQYSLAIVERRFYANQ